jgi:hypothetical protein
VQLYGGTSAAGAGGKQGELRDAMKRSQEEIRKAIPVAEETGEDRD